MKFGGPDFAGSDAPPPARPYRVIPVVPRGFWLGLLLVLATLAAYWPVFSAGFIWDDDDYVTENQNLRDSAGLGQIWFNPAATPQYYPLVHTTFWLEYHLWGLQPVGFHVVNVLLHLLGAMLVWRVLAGLNVPGAWLAAAIFSLHPVQVESVAWVTERKNVLSAVLYFSAVLCYLRFAGLIGVAGESVRRASYYAALGLFVAALLSKTVACSLPAAMLLVLWWKKDRLRWGDVAPLVPFFVLGAGLGLLTAWLEKHHVGAQGANWSLTPVERCLIAGRALCFYVAKLAWPHPLTFIYPRWTINSGLWWQWLFLVAVFSVVCGLWLARHKTGRGVLVAVLFFGGTLLPALGFINLYPMLYSFVADHFQYLASIGMIALAASLAVQFMQRWSVDPRLQAILAASLLVLLGGLTWRQCWVYQNLETLWADTLDKNPRCWMAHNNLGRLLAKQQKFDAAEAHYLAALALDPGVDTLHYNYGNLLARTGRLEAAAAQYLAALQIAPEKPETHLAFGAVLYLQHHAGESIAEFERAIFYKPDYADAYYDLGKALSSQHRMAAAAAAYQHALRLQPDSELFRKRLQAVTTRAGEGP
jgi:tetratricopeptide (TPR) repeat protein